MSDHVLIKARQCGIIKARILQTALANGFKLKKQPSGEMDLNPYVYDFAMAFISQHEKAKEELSEVERIRLQDQAKITELQLQLEKEKEATRNALADRAQVTKQLTKVREANEQLANKIEVTEEELAQVYDSLHEAQERWAHHLRDMEMVGELKGENDALKAYCEELKSVFLEGFDPSINFDEWEQGAKQLLGRNFSTDLAERDASVIEGFADHLGQIFGGLHTSMECITEAESYANQLREGAKDE